MQYGQEIETARRIADQSAKLALRHQKAGISAENKPDDSPVTIADKECEKMIAKMLEEAFPDDGILGEEGSRKESKNGRRWIIDPIDGARRGCVSQRSPAARLLHRQTGKRGNFPEQPKSDEGRTANGGVSGFLLGL